MTTKKVDVTEIVEAVAVDIKKVLVGVSGGVDSSVCVDLLKKQGYEVYGAVINFSDHSEMAIADARKVCAHLQIPICVINAQQAFEEMVIQPFCQNYIEGKTPNPCVMCNPNVKFKMLCEKADEMGIYYVATGHYAQVQEKDGNFYIKKALSPFKDQSYMLYRLPQEVLKRLVLPLGQYEKPEIRDKAKDIGLFTAEKPDSQEICFIPSGNHAAFIEARGHKPRLGHFISPEGTKLFKHKGVHHYTVGQRKGLNVALGKPAFVKEITEKGDILLGYAGDEFFSQVTLTAPVYTTGVFLPVNSDFSVKIRSASKGDTATVVASDAQTIVLSFPTPVRAAAKGQSVVIYQDDLVVAGGYIQYAIPAKKESEN